jgi:DUF1365 family protein
MHHRLLPLRRKFVYRLFMFYLDVEEIDALSSRLRLLSRNRWNLFSFRDRDHIDAGGETVRANLVHYLRTQGVELGDGRAFLLTHLRVLGYVFNPVSFYFCFDSDGRPLCAVPEVGNTFGELKPFFIGRDRMSEGMFRDRQVKHFYVSPFADLDTSFDFQLAVPDERLRIRIDDYEDGTKFFLSALTGERKPLTDGRLVLSFFRFPFITLQVIGLIHYHAIVLYLQGLPWHRKSEHPELQEGVYPWNK